MQFDDEGTIKRRVRWYFTAPGAKSFPGGTAFASSNWGVLAGGQMGIGECFDSARPWSNGSRPVGLDGKGKFCGEAAWFREGVPPGTPPVSISGGVPICCSNANYKGQIGGKGRPDVFFPSCQTWPDGTLVYVTGGFYNNTAAATIHAASITIPMRGVTHAFYSFYFTNQPNPFNVCNYGGTIVETPTEPQFFLSPPPARNVPGYDLVYTSTAPDWPFEDRLVRVRFGRSPYAGRVGGRGRPDGQIGTYSGQIGGAGGIAGFVPLVYAGDIGGEGGIESELRAVVAGDVGGEGGIESVWRSIVGGQIGGEGGIESELRASLAGSVGGEGRPDASSIKATIAGAIGGEGRPAGSPFGAIATNCCPSNPTPLVLHGTGSSGTAFTATWSAVSGGWPFTDPDTGLVWALRCTSVGAGWQWRATHVDPGCPVAFTEITKICSPFFISIRTTVTPSHCFDPGVYNFTFSA